MRRSPPAEFRDPRNNRGNTFLFSGFLRILHWGVAKVAPHTGHAVAYLSAFHFFSEGTTGILDAPVAVQQWFCVRIFLKRLIEGVQNKRCIIAAAQGERNDIPSVQIRHSTQVRLADGAIFELCYVSHPLLILPVSFCRSDENSLFRTFSATYSDGVFFLYSRFFILQTDRRPSTRIRR